MTAVAVIGATLAVVSVGLIVLAALLVLERRRPHPDIAAMAATNQAMLDTIDRLCDRIQAPQMAALRMQPVVPEENPPGVSIFDDDEYWESREQLAERLAGAEMNGGGDD